METLYKKLLTRLGGIEEIRYIDLNSGQLQLPKPPITYPAVLIRISEDRQDIDSIFQIVTGNIELIVIDKHLSETHNIAEKTIREKGLKYMQLNGKVSDALQGFKDGTFEPFTCRSKNDVHIRAGLKTVVQRWDTAWKESYSSNEDADTNP